jgi:hypothetical protein
MLDWEVTGDLVTLVINQFRPPVTARRERAEEGEAAQAEVTAVKEAPERGPGSADGRRRDCRGQCCRHSGGS